MWPDLACRCPTSSCRLGGQENLPLPPLRVLSAGHEVTTGAVLPQRLLKIGGHSRGTHCGNPDHPIIRWLSHTTQGDLLGPHDAPLGRGIIYFKPKIQGAV